MSVVLIKKHLIKVNNNGDEQKKEIQEYFTTILKSFGWPDKIGQEHPITIGVSGASMIKLLASILSQMDKEQVKDLRFFPVDERLVALDDTESNVGGYLRELPEYFKKNFIQVNAISNAQLAAENFEHQLRTLNPKIENGMPSFDLCLLGLGPDGHTCSLFPGHKLLTEENVWIAPIEDSPKPPPRRVTVTLPVLNHAKNLVFIVNGEAKAEVIKKIIEDDDGIYPPTLIKPVNEMRITWFMDEGAASQLSCVKGTQ